MTSRRHIIEQMADEAGLTGDLRAAAVRRAADGVLMAAELRNWATT